MTENEAIIELHKIRPRGSIIPQKRAEALDVAIQAIEKQSMVNEILHELREYSAIGTVEEFKALKEKSVAKKPDYEGDGCWDGHVVIDTWMCPNCEKHYEVDYDDYDYCPNCGQHIDHSGLTEDD